jgi:hypothetical protein
MQSPLQRRRIADFFYLLDGDRDGALRWDDFARVATLISSLQGWSEQDDGALALKTAARMFWQSLIWVVPAEHPDRLTLKDLCDYAASLSRHVQQTGELPASLQANLDAWALLLDIDGDGLVGEVDYTCWLTALGSSADPETAFARLDTSRDGVLARAELDDRVREWWTSEDEDAPGNLLATGRSG